MAMDQKTLANAFRNVARSRRSAKRFHPNRTIEGHVLKDVLETSLVRTLAIGRFLGLSHFAHSLQRSPSSFNLQPSQIILVQSQETKNLLAEKAMLGAGNQFRTRDSSALAVFLSDLELGSRIERIEHLERSSGTRDPNYLNVLPIAASFLSGEGHLATVAKQTATSLLSPIQAMPTVEPVQSWSSKNTGLLAQTFVMALTSHGLASCIMEGFDDRRAKEVLRIPDRYAIPLMVATGYDYFDGEDESPPTPRLPLEEVVFDDTFGAPLKDLDNDDADELDNEQTSAV